MAHAHHRQLAPPCRRDVLEGLHLSHHHSLADLKKLGHDLVRCWVGFKVLFPGEILSQHDDIVNTLNEFEDLRYPDDLLRSGAHITVGFVTSRAIGGPATGVIEKGYQLSVTDVDALMEKLFELCGINPAGYMSHYGNTVKVVEWNNVSCQGWFPERERLRRQVKANASFGLGTNPPNKSRSEEDRSSHRN